MLSCPCELMTTLHENDAPTESYSDMTPPEMAGSGSLDSFGDVFIYTDR